MAMDDRKMRILQAIIDDYILTGVPVGSRTISKKYDMGLSSATIRNEMSDLEELGFLDQPHVSAGRIPSAKASAAGDSGRPARVARYMSRTQCLLSTM